MAAGELRSQKSLKRDVERIFPGAEESQRYREPFEAATLECCRASWGARLCGLHDVRT